MRLFGKNPVVERLRANPISIKTVYIQHDYNDRAYIQSKAQQKKVHISIVEPVRMHKMAKGANHQGIMADVDEFRYTDFNDLLDDALEKNRCPVFLDEITDPQNLGAIIRTLGCLGKFSIILPTRESVGITEAVLRVACGGENYVPIAKVNNLHNAVVKAKEAGFFIAGAVVENGQNIADAEMSFPWAVVVGSEQKGIREMIRKKLDVEVTIPMPVATMALNVAQATGILCYEVTRRTYAKKQEKK